MIFGIPDRWSRYISYMYDSRTFAQNIAHEGNICCITVHFTSWASPAIYVLRFTMCVHMYVLFSHQSGKLIIVHTRNHDHMTTQGMLGCLYCDQILSELATEEKKTL